MPLKKPLSLIHPHAIRRIPPSFAWLDHRLRSNGFLETFTPSEIALYFFSYSPPTTRGLLGRFGIALERSVVDGLENGSRVDENHAVGRHRTQCVCAWSRISHRSQTDRTRNEILRNAITSYSVDWTVEYVHRTRKICRLISGGSLYENRRLLSSVWVRMW